jgi:predicted RNA binding protein YcfA (HicA-like mRNA interferase family)
MDSMTQIEKLIERLRRAQGPILYEDLRRLLEREGWALASQVGSHVTFRKPPAAPIHFPLVSGRRVKATYVREVLKTLGYWT